MRLIDADAIKLPEGFFEKVDNVPKFYDWLNSLPTIDAVRVIRCKDCSRFRTRTDGSVYCYNGMSIGNKNDYCSYAERRTDAD